MAKWGIRKEISFLEEGVVGRESEGAISGGICIKKLVLSWPKISFQTTSSNRFQYLVPVNVAAHRHLLAVCINLHFLHPCPISITIFIIIIQYTKWLPNIILKSILPIIGSSVVVFALPFNFDRHFRSLFSWIPTISTFNSTVWTMYAKQTK